MKNFVVVTTSASIIQYPSIFLNATFLAETAGSHGQLALSFDLACPSPQHPGQSQVRNEYDIGSAVLLSQVEFESTPDSYPHKPDDLEFLASQNKPFSRSLAAERATYQCQKVRKPFCCESFLSDWSSAPGRRTLVLQRRFPLRMAHCVRKIHLIPPRLPTYFER